MTKRLGMWRFLWCGGLTLAVVSAAATACMDYRPRPTGLVRDVLSDDPARAKRAVESLREMGPQGLGALMSAYAPAIRRQTARWVAYPQVGPDVGVAAFLEASTEKAQRDLVQEASPRPDHLRDPAVEWKRLSAAIDAVAAQKDAAFSGLYWHTDLDKAKAAARESGKPILSLRLLGTLDTEFSCANSRFFRTVLYANAEVSAALRERFVLHWQSVRPVPKVTIDMGDGRVIERTITGNSIHYVLDADGRPVDAAPGLYGPKAFLRVLDDAGRAVRALDQLAGAEAKQTYLVDWHGARATQLTEQWERDFAQVKAGTAGAGTLVPVNATGATLLHSATLTPLAPTAVEASRAAVGKSVVEFSLARALAPRIASLNVTTDDATWAKIAALPAHAEDARLDKGSETLLRRKHAGTSAPAAGALSLAKSRQEDPLVRVVAGFERSVAEDTVRNEYRFHRAIHEWFAGRTPETLGGDVGPLNERVYAELFLTPSSDRWLGLVPADAYAALEGGGELKQ